MKYIGIGCIWLGYAGVVAAVAFGTHNGAAVMTAVLFGAVFASVTTIFID